MQPVENITPHYLTRYLRRAETVYQSWPLMQVIVIVKISQTKKEAGILSLLKARTNTSKRNSQSNKGSQKPLKGKICSQACQLSSDLDLQIDEEILLEYDKSHVAKNEEGPEILKPLAERVDRY